ncbi:hypothetical protein ABZP36_009419 [Zizania latifolia]
MRNATFGAMVTEAQVMVRICNSRDGDRRTAVSGTVVGGAESIGAAFLLFCVGQPCTQEEVSLYLCPRGPSYAHHARKGQGRIPDANQQ